VPETVTEPYGFACVREASGGAAGTCTAFVLAATTGLRNKCAPGALNA